ncbi:plastocyanin/azurin family copper-binding protein [Halobellus clavatus]|jgi:plastocyanin|uniref:Plastocyanin n=1 Tax=Halobellus clavatus TaxID=660517 RepID=A0A1H3CKM5_9EURY|nr:plastocyanin/azurin family copper-binding protein [Halobellus clavatus]SDX54646.1 Plastocyanin [Halobellus clavatus]
MTDGNAEMSRRAFLTTAAGTAAATGAAGTAAAQEDGGGGGATETVTVGPGGSLVYEPGTEEPLEITPGTTVEFVWDSDNHNIVVESQPEGANWEGHEPIENTGFTYTHTFETVGTYEYYCQPHRTAGMVASIEVVESLSTPSGSGAPELPNSAKTLGVATTFAMVATLGLAFFFLKYGGDYEIEEE